MVEKLEGCLKCGLPVPGAATGRPAIYCGPGCRNAAAIEVRRCRRILDTLEDKLVALRHELIEEQFEKPRSYGAKGKPYWARLRREIDHYESEIARYEGRLVRLLNEGGAAPERGGF